MFLEENNNPLIKSIKIGKRLFNFPLVNCHITRYKWVKQKEIIISTNDFITLLSLNIQCIILYYVFSYILLKILDPGFLISLHGSYQISLKIMRKIGTIINDIEMTTSTFEIVSAYLIANVEIDHD